MFSRAAWLAGAAKELCHLLEAWFARASAIHVQLDADQAQAAAKHEGITEEEGLEL